MRRALIALLLSLSAASAAGLEADVPLLEKNGATLYVAGRIEGYGATEFLLDTGASYMAINERLLKRLESTGNARFLRRLNGTFADGRSRVISIYSISGIHIGEDCGLREVEVAVLPGSTRNILGLSVLRRTAPFTLSMDPPRLSLSGCEDA